MGIIRPPERAILFIAMLSMDERIVRECFLVLIKEFGEVLYETPIFDWNWSDYYKKEMGDSIKRTFIFFKEPIDSSTLAEIKLKTNEIERLFSRTDQGAAMKRRINLDPGYLTLSKVVLASTKNYCHRIYLGRGIYAEVTLYYRDNSFRPHIFTYRDYADPSTISIFNNARHMLRSILSEKRDEKDTNS